MKKVFRVTDGRWRGLGKISDSKYLFREEFDGFDANLRYGTKVGIGVDIQPGCKCHLIIVGKIKPNQCLLFMKTCTPKNPVGACMVGREGTCRIWARSKSYRYLKI
jgi:hydrogenase expression/formation protein HypD